MPRGFKKVWTPREDDLIREAWAREPVTTIARRLSSWPSTVRIRAAQLYLPTRANTNRPVPQLDPRLKAKAERLKLIRKLVLARKK